MILTRNFLLYCAFAILLVHYAEAESKKANGTTTTTTQVPVLDLKQILEIANPSIKSVNETTTAAPANVTTPLPVSSSTTTTQLPTTSPTIPSTTTLSTTTTTTTTEVSSTSSQASTAANTSTAAPEPLRESATTANQTEVTSDSTSVTTEKPVLLSENVSNVAPEALMESTSLPQVTTTTTEATTTTSTTTPTTTTTTTKAPIILGPIVKIIPGELRPAVLRSRGGKRYYAFRGIPYANPPIHFQRFKEPAPVSPWAGILNATTFGPACIQYNILSGKVEGEEDCLTLNIFTNTLPSGRNRKRGPYPVMVFFHQGAFMFGTSSDFQENYMMDEQVVLVTVQYRLGAFGFLNTQGGSDARGNQGLKDQLLALRFVKENIHYFNGDPNLVTIFGESAGGSSVHYHLLSEQSRGLFHRAISMSGTALSPWAFTRSPRKMAKKLGTFMNCPTTDMNELATCLQGHDARIVAEKTKELYEWNTDPITPFAPSVEFEDTISAFLTESPYTLMKSGRINDATPWMLGVVENVCLLDAWSVLIDKQLTDDLNADWHRVAPVTFMFKETALEPDAVSNQVRAYYFGTREINNATSQELEQLYSDRYFNHGIRTSALTHVRTNEAIPVYLYIFSYKGAQSHTKFAGISDILGVSEGDDLRFLFNTDRFEDIPLNSTDGKVSQNFVRLWVSFAKEGKPTAVWGEQEWKRISPAQVKGDEALMYYSLNEKCGFVEEPFSSRMNFWDTLPLNENENEVSNSYNIHYRFPEQDDDLFNRYN